MPACSRCHQPAAAMLGYAYAARQAWLSDIGTGSAPPGIVLCHHHADGVTPPVGWVLHDRRSPAPTLFDAGAA